MKEIILLKLGEIVLKGLNRSNFEKKLMANVKRRIQNCGDFKIYSVQSTIYVEPQDENCDIVKVFEICKKIFGITAVSRAAECEKDIGVITKTAIEYLADDFAAARSFKVESKRSDKGFPMTSIQISQTVGGDLHDAFGVRVDVKNPELLVNVEIRDYAAYVHKAAEPGVGGMPVGSNGRAVCLLSGGIDSPVAAYMIAKRGVFLTPVHFFSYPYTSQRARDKVEKLAEILTDYCGPLEVHMVPFTQVQEEIADKCPEEYFTIIMRRIMMRIAEEIAARTGGKAIVTGESLGQVASQTMEAMSVTEAVCSLPVFRPVVGMDKEEIVKLARKIGTFDTSVLPYEDCCTVFTPKHPKTKPKLADVENVEKVLDIDALVETALENMERVMIAQ